MATAIIIFSLAAIATLRATKLYEARSRLAIFPEERNVLGLKDGDSPGYYGGEDDTALDTQVEILRSDALALKVIESMGLDRNPSFSGEKAVSASSGMEGSKLDPDPARVSSLIGRFRGGLTVQMVPRTRIVELRYMDPDPRLATEIVNGLAKTFREENFRTKYDAAMQTSDWLSKEMTDVQLKMETSEEKLVRYQKQHGILGIDEKQNIVTTKLDSLNKDLTDAQSDRMQKEADYNLAGTGSPDAIVHVANSAGLPSLIEKLQEKEADLNEQLAQVTTAFGSAYPKTEQLQNQLKQVRASMVIEEGRIRDKIKNRYLTAQQREKLLQAAFERQKQDANNLNQSAIEFMSLKRDAESNRQLYLNMLQRLKEAGVT
ncbi:MAG: GumC family protein, partial [Acidobacteriota bacterium]|nr:GumC family protein [Acidobacteriota bacterium]